MVADRLEHTYSEVKPRAKQSFVQLMALMVLEDCINCDACRAEFPTESRVNMRLDPTAYKSIRA